MNPNISDKNFWFDPTSIRIKPEERIQTNDLCHVFGRTDTGRIIAGPEVRPDYDDMPVEWWHLEIGDSREWHPKYHITECWRNDTTTRPFELPVVDTSNLGTGVRHGE